MSVWTAFALGVTIGALVATVLWMIWAYRAMKP